MRVSPYEFASSAIAGMHRVQVILETGLWASPVISPRPPGLRMEHSVQEPVRIGFVGARFAANFHWDGLRRVYGVPVEIVGVTSQTADTRDAFARENGNSRIR